MTGKKSVWLWYTATATLVAVALYAINYILFLAMESARTHANLPAIREKYHWALVVLIVSLACALYCFIKGRRRASALARNGDGK